MQNAEKAKLQTDKDSSGLSDGHQSKADCVAALSCTCNCCLKVADCVAAAPKVLFAAACAAISC